MSGIELVYNGKLLVKEQDFGNIELSGKEVGNQRNRVILSYNYKYTFKPTYKIFKLSKDSPAYKAGLMVNDIVIKINGQYTYNLKLEEIVGKFYEKEHKKIKLVIERNGKDYEYQFELKNMLK